MRRLFVTGTDTGAGKTFVTAAMARQARANGKKVFAFKPIESGCERVDDRLVGPDQETISVAAGDWQRGPLRGLYQLIHPLAPHVAAKTESVDIDLDLIARTANSVSDADVLLVEGAGGWRVPITSEHDMSSLAQRLDAEVIVVARAGLGTINHSLLTVEAVERDGRTIAALVLSRRPDEDRELAVSNGDEIRRRWNGTVLMFDTDPTIFDPLL